MLNTCDWTLYDSVQRRVLTVGGELLRSGKYFGVWEDGKFFLVFEGAANIWQPLRDCKNTCKRQCYALRSPSYWRSSAVRANAITTVMTTWPHWFFVLVLTVRVNIWNRQSDNCYSSASVYNPIKNKDEPLRLKCFELSTDLKPTRSWKSYESNKFVWLKRDINDTINA